MPIELTKDAVDSSYLGSVRFEEKKVKQIKHARKEPFFIILTKQKI